MSEESTNSKSKDGNGLVYPRSPYGLGIDLGTTNSSAAIFAAGKTHDIKFDGKDSMPSAVWFKKDKNNEEYEIVVGRSAKNRALAYPDQVFLSTKTLMKDDDWKKDKSISEKYNGIAIKNEKGEAIELTPTLVAAEILKKIMNEANAITDLDIGGEIRKVAICVPANSTNEYKENVFKAAIEAGIGYIDDNGYPVLDDVGHPLGVVLLDEPKAAAMQYSIDGNFFSKDKEQTIMVYDFGGGTFDVTILSVDSSSIPTSFNVLATQGVTELGGDNIDIEIMKIAAEHLKELSGIDIFDTKSDNRGTKVKELKDAQQKLKEVAESEKINSLATGVAESDAPFNISKIFTDGEGESFDLNCTIKKSEVLARIDPILNRTIECADNALAEAKITINDVNRIVLVGGSSKADWVIEKLKNHYNKDPYTAPQIDLYVGKGAAFYIASIPNEYEETVKVPCSNPEGCTAILDQAPSVENPCPVCGYNGVNLKETYIPKNIGIMTTGGGFGIVLPKGEIKEDKPKDSNIIISAKRKFGNPNNAESILINIYETIESLDIEEKDGEFITTKDYSVYEKKDDNKVFQFLGDFTLSGLTRAPQGTIPIEVTVELDTNKTIHVTATAQGQTGDIKLTVDKK